MVVGVCARLETATRHAPVLCRTCPGRVRDVSRTPLWHVPQARAGAVLDVPDPPFVQRGLHRLRADRVPLAPEASSCEVRLFTPSL